MSDRRSTHTGWLFKTANVSFVVLAAIAFYEMRIKPGFYGFDTKFEAIVKARVFPEAPNLIVRDIYTGVASIDYGLQFLVAAFLPGVAGYSKEFQAQQRYFLFSFFPLITIYNIEAGRNSLRGSLASYTSFWALLYQTVGGAVIIPLYCLAILWKASSTEYYSIQGRNMSSVYHKALVPALLLGYLLPTVAMYAPFPDKGYFTRQGLIAVWQVCPILVNVLLAIFSALYSRLSASKAGFANITFLYAVSAITAAAAHFHLLYTCFLDANPLSLLKVLWPRSEMLEGRATDTLHYVFNVDYLIIFGSSLLLAIATVDIASRIRNVKTGLFTLTTGVIGSSMFVGPAATIALFWWWRESLMLKSQKKLVT